MLSGWRYYWRKYLGLIPIQPCYNCGRLFWAGWPYPSLHAWRLGYFWQWAPGYADVCSKSCHDEDLERLC